MSLRSRRRPDRGIVLLIALGMLSLFSVLIVSYVVFSSQQQQIAVSASQRRVENIDPKPVMETVITSLVAGDSNPKSPAFQEDLLGDLYGNDHLKLRVAHRRDAGSGGSIQERGMLLAPMPASPPPGNPGSTLFKFPLHLANWHNDGNVTFPYTTELADEVVTPLTGTEFAAANWEQTLRARHLPDYRMNDVFAGRLLTFTDGPLANVTFRVVRSIGTDVAPGGTAADVGLAGCLVVDLSELGGSEVELNDAIRDVYSLASNYPNALLYGPGPDGAPGQRNVDDDGANGVDDEGEFGWAGTDDVGYPMLMNGVPFNGRGRNAIAATGLTVPNPNNPTAPNADFVFDTQFGPELLPNQRITGLTRQSAAAEPDELYDAADFDNWFLAWQPSDHRGILPAVAANTGLSTDAAPSVIPSYHRPAVVNYLMHAPIWYDDNGDGNRDASEYRRFSQLAAANTNDDQRLRILYQRIRAAVYRPLNFSHAFFSGGSATDVNGDGNPFDGAPAFSGSNPTAILNNPIDTGNFAQAYNSLRLLATWLVNGPWDVDNDGDGVRDSLWIDFDLPEQTLADGTIVRPMVAPLIEDLDGRINLNRAGTWSQFTTQRFNLSNPTSYQPAASPPNPDAQYFTTMRSLQFFGRGGGVGPAEISFTHLFDEYRTGNPFQPQFYTQTSPPLTNVLRTRAGNVMQSRYGGVPYDFVGNLANFPVAMPGEESGPSTQPLFSDPLSRVPFPMRRDLHAPDAPMGLALDMHGRSTERLDFAGNVRTDFVGATVTLPTPTGPNVTISEVINQPYEFETDQPAGNDKPFTAPEFYSLVRRGTADAISKRLVELLGDVADRNEAVDRLVSFDSRSLDVIELPGGQSIVQYVMSKMPANRRQNDPDWINEQIERIVAVELRKGGRFNLNRPLGNGQDDDGMFVDETDETAQATPDTRAAENAFPQLANTTVQTFNTEANVRADYQPIDTPAATGGELPQLSAGELFARQLYFLMFRLILDPDADPNSYATSELVPNFPYPPGMTTAAGDVELRNRYVAKRLAQWAVNAVDMRDTNAIMTRLRYDPNPFDSDGFDLATAAPANVVWGLERREVELTETLSFHDRRVKRNLHTIDEMVYQPTDIDGDGEYQGDEADTDPASDPKSDQELDQFRIPEATSVVELRSLRSPHNGASTFNQASYPAELYDFGGSVPRLDLGRTVGNNAAITPVWRMAVGYTDRDGSPASAHHRSALWVNEAERMSTLNVAAGQLPDPMAELTGANADHTPGDNSSNWSQRIRHVAEVNHPVGLNDRVILYDDDLDPATAPPEEIMLDRFVWFTNQTPLSAGGLNVANPGVSPESGMSPENVFFRSGVVNTNTGNFENVPPMLEGGQYAVVLPRSSTVLGSTRESTAAQNWPYRPSPQQIEFFGGLGTHQLRYFDLGNDRGSPRPQVDGGGYRQRSILPIVAVSLLPHQIDNTRTDWADYNDDGAGPRPTIPLEDRVSVGFNISAPLSGTAYYPAPTHYINDGSSNAPDKYPFYDGYRDYENSLGIHADVPFDEEPGAPLRVNNWLEIGNYQDVATLFLQRLADPTRPWNKDHNPYITVDYLTMDLTVFNGEEDMSQLIDRDAGGAQDDPVDVHTPTYPSEIAFDTRRKIPDSRRERPLSELVPRNLGGDMGDMTNYNRMLFAQRSPLMSLQSVLRNQPAQPIAATSPYFNFEMVSGWEGDNPAAATSSLDTNFEYDPTQHRFDVPAEPFHQTLGFLNREFGEPARAFTFFAGSTNGSQPGDYVGYPVGVSLLMPQHPDRPFQSPYDLVTVPAVSATRLNTDFGPGTTLNNNTFPHQEIPADFAHLLGFERGIGDFDANDQYNLAASQPASIIDASTTTGFSQLTGGRAGFEQIFDLVDTGPVSFGERRWLDPTQVNRKPGASTREAMFNRVVSTLQPPFNYIEEHRSEGKINLNTTPDYVRRGASYSGVFATSDPNFQRPLDAGERPDDPDTNGNVSGIGSDPTNRNAGTGSDPINSSVLYGNGSVYRALAWGHSTAYELDDTLGEPIVMGAVNRYKSSVDSRFGLGFKAFIESRRGYATSYVNPTRSWSGTHFRNLELDFRYPSRFAGMFAPAAGSTLPSVQRYLRTGAYNPTQSMLRRTHDMSLLRPHPDFDVRLMDDDDSDDGGSEFPDDRAKAQNNQAYMLGAELPPPNSGSYQVSMPPLRFVANASTNANHEGNQVFPGGEPNWLQFNMVGTSLFERPQVELHKNVRHLDRDAHFRFENARRLSNLTTHHSNVFMVRFTLGYFEVDPNTGSLGQEHLDPRDGYKRPRGFYVIDRSIPVAYESGEKHNAMNTVIFAGSEEN